MTDSGRTRESQASSSPCERSLLRHHHRQALPPLAQAIINLRTGGFGSKALLISSSFGTELNLGVFSLTSKLRKPLAKVL